MRVFPVLAALAVGVSLAAGAPSSQRVAGEDPAPSPPKVQRATVDATAADVLRRAARYYLDVAEGSARLHVHSRRGMPGQERVNDVDYDLAFRRPNKMALRSHGETEMGGQVVSDGQKLHVYAAVTGSHWEMPAPRAAGDAFLGRDAKLASVAGGFDFELLSGLFGETPYEQLTAAATALEYAGEEQIDAGRAHHVVVRRAESDVHLWFAAEGAPWLLQARPDLERYLARLARNAPNAAPVQFDILITCRDWSTSAVAEATFAFSAPNGSKVATGDPRRGAPDQNSLVGKPSPAFTAPTLSGGQIDLDSLRGRIVILDFWATWCPPCQRGLPIIEAVSNAYADRNVSFYAVNLRELPTQIQSFMSRKGHKFEVVLDQNGKLAQTFGVGPIPHTVILGSDGIVEAVHVGLPPNLDQLLRSELDTLLGGGKLAR